ncbi:hypothetical protein STEG23_021338 [Scotinomys teguina]
MVNYAWAGRSQRKLWWRSVAVLTCKSVVRPGVGVDQYSRLPAPGSRLPAPGIVDAAGRPDVRVRTLPAPASARIAG